MNIAASQHAPAAATSSERRLSAIFAAALGIVILFAAGFAPSEVVHNAAHDSRHSFSFPCH